MRRNECDVCVNTAGRGYVCLYGVWETDRERQNEKERESEHERTKEIRRYRETVALSEMDHNMRLSECADIYVYLYEIMPMSVAYRHIIHI